MKLLYGLCASALISCQIVLPSQSPTSQNATPPPPLLFTCSPSAKNSVLIQARRARSGSLPDIKEEREGKKGQEVNVKTAPATAPAKSSASASPHAVSQPIPIPLRSRSVTPRAKAYGAYIYQSRPAVTSPLSIPVQAYSPHEVHAPELVFSPLSRTQDQTIAAHLKEKLESLDSFIELWGEQVSGSQIQRDKKQLALLLAQAKAIINKYSL
jgi:hypothetical protein